MLEIIQGSNSPIELSFSEDISSSTKLEVSLNNRDTEIKHWDKADVTIDGKTVTLPLTETETLAFRSGKYYLDVKLLDVDGVIIFYDSVPTVVSYKFDKTKMGV